MADEASDRKIGLVAFNNEVTVVGDGSEIPQTISGGKLNNYDFLIENGKEQGIKMMKHKIKDTMK